MHGFGLAGLTGLVWSGDLAASSGNNLYLAESFSPFHALRLQISPDLDSSAQQKCQISKISSAKEC